jgi:hypothetical protein
MMHHQYIIKTAARSSNNHNGSISMSHINLTWRQYDENHIASGNIFEHHQDCSIFNRYSLHKWNTIYIYIYTHLENDAPYVNNKIWCFVLSQRVYSQSIFLNCGDNFAEHIRLNNKTPECRNIICFVLITKMLDVYIKRELSAS